MCFGKKDKDDRIDRQNGSYPETPSASKPVDYVYNPFQSPMLQVTKIAFPEYSSKMSREQTFDDWPKAMNQTPNQLSDAGFFYAQKGDQVICYCCGGSLRGWSAQDNPWVQHALWFSICPHVQIMRGLKYIEAVKWNYTQKVSNDGQHLLIPPPPPEPGCSKDGKLYEAFFSCGRSIYTNYVKVKCKHCGKPAEAFMKLYSNYF